MVCVFRKHLFGGIARQEAVPVEPPAGRAPPDDLRDEPPGLLPVEDGTDQGGDDQDVPVVLQVLRDAVGVAEGQGWRLDSEHESESDGAEEEDGDRAPDPEDLLRRRQRRARTPISRPLRAAAAAEEPQERSGPQFSGVRVAHRVFQVADLGSLRFDTHLRIMSAHCKCDRHGTCRMNRTVRPGRRPEQGRPLGYLLAWMLAPHSRPVEFPDRASHAELAVCEGIYKDNPSVSYAERCRLRAWAKSLPSLAPLFAEGLEDGGAAAEEPHELA